MEKRVEKIKKLCEENGLSEAEVLREADVSSITLQNWSKNEPKSFQIYDAIIVAIDKLSGKKIFFCQENDNCQEQCITCFSKTV